jgi:outer membrane protein TolC
LGSQIQSDESFYNRLEKLYRLTQAREKQGRNTRVDSLRVELQRGQALSRLENNRERLYSTQQDFAELLGFDPAQTFRLDTPPRFTFDIPPIEEAVRIALENRLDYAQVLQDLQDARRGVKIARRRLHPALNLVARYERFGEGDGFSEVSTLDEDTVLFGLSTDADFNQARERASFGQAVIDEESGRQIIRIREVSIAREVQQQLAAHRRAQTDVSIAGRNFRLADNRARLARRLFESGRGDNLSVTDAEDAYVQAQAQLLAATAEASISTYRILRVLGTLMEFPEELKPGALRAAL